jgi:hypothetical protein
MYLQRQEVGWICPREIRIVDKVGDVTLFFSDTDLPEKGKDAQDLGNVSRPAIHPVVYNETRPRELRDASFCRMCHRGEK